jgi:hypothetical protein
MQFKIVDPDPKRYAKREKAIRYRSESMNAQEIETHISKLTEALKADSDDEAPEYPALMINTILWDALVEALEIWKKIQAERVA